MQKQLEIRIPDGSLNSLTVFQEEPAKTANLLLLFPAMGVKAGYYRPFVEAFARRGFIVITADLRGLGHSSVHPSKTSDFGYEEMMQLDFLSIFKAIEQHFPNHFNWARQPEKMIDLIVDWVPS